MQNTALSTTPPVAEAGFAKPKILAVDDEPINLFLLEDIIEDSYDLSLVASGAECLSQVDTICPDLILLDINMPEITGFEVCEKLKSNPDTASIPVIFLTAMLSVEDERKGLQMGAVDYITKPFSESILLARIETQLTLARAQKVIEDSHRALQKEQLYIENIIASMRDDPRFESANVKQSLSPVENSNGDIVLSASNATQQQHLMVGDFTGHGLTAAIAGPLVSSMFYSNVQNNLYPQHVLEAINFELYHKLPAQKFLAAAYVFWQKESKQIAIYNLGMPAILLFKKQKPQSPIIVKSSSLALGVLERMTTPCYELQDFQEGDRIMVVTDGLIDPRNNLTEFADEQAFIRYIQQKLKNLDDGQFILDELQGELSQIKATDDITLVEMIAHYE